MCHPRLSGGLGTPATISELRCLWEPCGGMTWGRWIPVGAVRRYPRCMIDTQAIRQRWDADGSKRDERGRRLFAASEVRAAGWGGLAAVSDITGLARSTIERGLKDLDAPPLAPGRVRREGGGPRPLTERDATLLRDLKRLVEPATLGDPDASAAVGVEEPRQARDGAGRDGPRDQPQQRAQAAHRARFLAAGQPQGRRGLAAIPIATPSSSTSTPRCWRRRPQASP